MHNGRITEKEQQPSANPKMNGFHGLGIAPRLLEAIDRLKFTEPTPIQERSIPVAIEGKDLIGIAQTGTGKTLAFGIPMLQRLAQVGGCGLVLLPTRELAIQVDEAFTELGRSFGLRTAVLIGGASMSVQRQYIKQKPHVIIATPGRLIDHLEQHFIDLGDVRVLVLDEADRMLDMGFAPQINKILAAVPRNRQTMLFSATMPKEIVAIAQHHMKLPISVEIARPGTTVDQVTQELFFVSKEDKGRLLELLLQQTIGPVLVFTRTKYGAKRLAYKVRTMGHEAAEIHSDRSLPQRKDAMGGFKSGKYRVLIATDIAARGIDVTGIEAVVNFDLPTHAEDYVHRIGRTARAGRTGRAVSFATFDQQQDVRSIERFIRATLPVKPLPKLPPARYEPRHPMSRQAYGRQRGRVDSRNRGYQRRSRSSFTRRRYR
ncbi:MAG: DEAD/DEAH box helicase [Patescibacteria group bacterium]|nr:DEAD/DEAH box helicase [Patescibacteria group bacterium]MDD5716018.1 DEAD/DEAH box helicase [Patescibacteria group bacterium]